MYPLTNAELKELRMEQNTVEMTCGMMNPGGTGRYQVESLLRIVIPSKHGAPRGVSMKFQTHET